MTCYAAVACSVTLSTGTLFAGAGLVAAAGLAPVASAAATLPGTYDQTVEVTAANSTAITLAAGQAGLVDYKSGEAYTGAVTMAADGSSTLVLLLEQATGNASFGSAITNTGNIIVSGAGKTLELTQGLESYGRQNWTINTNATLKANSSIWLNGEGAAGMITLEQGSSLVYGSHNSSMLGASGFVFNGTGTVSGFNDAGTMGTNWGLTLLDNASIKVTAAASGSTLSMTRMSVRSGMVFDIQGAGTVLNFSSQLSSIGVGASKTVTIKGGGTLDFTGSAYTNAVELGGVNFSVTESSVLKLNNAAARQTTGFTGIALGNSGVLDVTVTADLSAWNNGSITGAAGSRVVLNGGGNRWYGGFLTSAFATGGNVFKGTIEVASGRMEIGSNTGQFGDAGTSWIVRDGGQVYFGNGTYNGNISIEGTGWNASSDIAKGGCIRADGATLAGNITLLNNASITVWSGSTGTLSGKLLGSTTLEKLGAGTLNVSNANALKDFTGNLKLTGGLVNLSMTADMAMAGKLMLNSGTVDVTRSDVYGRRLFNGGVEVSGSGKITLSRTGLIWINSLTGNGTVNFERTGSGTYFSSFVLAGDGDFTGTITVGRNDATQNSYLVLQSANAAKNATVTLQNGSSLALTANTTIAGLNGAAGTMIVGMDALASTGQYDQNMPTKGTARTLTVNGGGNYAGSIGANVSLVKSGAGTLKLTGALDASSSYSATGGTLEFGQTGNQTLTVSGSNGATLAFTGGGKYTLAAAGDFSGAVLGISNGSTVIMGGAGVAGLAVGSGLNYLNITSTSPSYALGTISGAGSLVLELANASMKLVADHIGDTSLYLKNGDALSRLTLDETGILQAVALAELTGSTTDDPAGEYSRVGGGVVLQSNLEIGSLMLMDKAGDANTLTITDSFTIGEKLTFAGTAGGSFALQGGALTIDTLIANSGLLNLNNTLTTANSLQGVGRVNLGSGSSLVLNGAGTFGGVVGMAGNAGLSLANGALGTGTINISGTGNRLEWLAGNTADYSGKLTVAANSGLTLNTGANNVGWGTAIGNTADYTKTGSGTLTLSVLNAIKGALTIDGGVVNLTAGGDNGSINGTVVIKNGVLRLNGGDVTGYGEGNRISAITIQEGGEMVIGVTANQTFSNMTLTLQGGKISGVANSNFDLFRNGSKVVTLASAQTSTISTNFNLRQDNTQFDIAKGTTANGIDLLVSGVIGNGDNGNHNFIKNGAGTMVLTGANTYGGTTTINGGTLQVGNGGASGSLGSGTVFINANGTLVFNRTDEYTFTNTIGLDANKSTGHIDIMSGTCTWNTGSQGNFTGTLTVHDGATLKLASNTYNVIGGTGHRTLIEAGGRVVFAVGGTDCHSYGQIEGAGHVEIASAADKIMYFDCANTLYTGGTIVKSGTAVMNQVGALGTGTITLQGGVLRAAVGHAFANAGGTNALDMQGGTLAASGNQTFSSTVLTSGVSTLALTLNNSGGAASLLSLDLGTLTRGIGYGSLNLALTGGPDVTLTGANVNDYLQLKATVDGDNTWLARAISYKIGDQLYRATGYDTDTRVISFAEASTTQLVQNSPSGTALDYIRTGGATLGAKSEELGGSTYEMRSLAIENGTGEGDSNALVLNGVTLKVNDVLSYGATTGPAYTIANGDAAGSLNAKAVVLTGGTLNLNVTTRQIGTMAGQGTIASSGGTTAVSDAIDGSLTLNLANSAAFSFTGTTGSLAAMNVASGSAAAFLTGKTSLSGTLALANNGSSLQVGRAASEGVAASNAVLTMQNLQVNTGGDNNSTSLNIAAGSVMNVLGTTNGSAGEGSFTMSVAGGTFTTNVNGTLNINSDISNRDGNGTLNINNGGVMNFRNGLGITRNGAASNWGRVTLNLNAGGTMNIGAGGIKGSVVHTMNTINLNGGTIGALANWTSSVALNLQGAVTFNTELYVADDGSGATSGYSGQAGTIGLSGALTATEAGSLVKDGLGTLTITGAQGGFGGTMTSRKGTLDISGTTGLGTNAVSLVLDGGALNVGSLNGGMTVRSAAAGGQLGNLTLNGGTINIDLALLPDAGTAAYTVGTLSAGAGKTTFHIENFASLALGEHTYTLFNVTGANNITTEALQSLVGASGLVISEDSRSKLEFTSSASSVTMKYTNAGIATLVWQNTANNWQMKGSADAWASGSGTLADTSFHTGDNVIFNAQSPVPAVAESVKLSGLVAPGSITVNGGNYSFDNAAADARGYLSGSGKLTMAGGTLAINTNNKGVAASEGVAAIDPWSGGVALNGGTLIAGADGALGTGTLVFGGGTLEFVSANALGGAMSIADNASGTLKWGAGNTMNYTDNLVSFGANSTLNIFSNGNTFNMNQTLAAGQKLVINDVFAGNVTLAGTGGTLEIVQNASVNSAIWQGASYIVNGGLTSGGGGTYTSGSISGSGTLTFNNTGGTFTWATSGNDFTGDIRLTGSKLVVFGENALGTGSSFLTNGGAASSIDIGANASLVLNRQFAAADKAAAKANALVIGNLTGSGIIRGDYTTNTADFRERYISTTVASGEAVYGGIFQRQTNTDVGLLKNGAGTFVLTGTNTSIADLDVNAGSMVLRDGGVWAGDINVLGTSSLAFDNNIDVTQSRNVTSAAGATITFQNGKTYTLAGAANAIGGAVVVQGGSKLAVSGTFGTGSVSLATAADTLELSGTNKTLSGAISGNGGVIVSGGEITLSGANSYKAGTTVSGGTLILGSTGAAGDGIIALTGGALNVNGQVVLNGVAANQGTSSIIGGADSSIGALTVGSADAAATLNVSDALTVASINVLARVNGNNTLNATGGLSVTGAFNVGQNGAVALASASLGSGLSLGQDAAFSSGALTVSGTVSTATGASMNTGAVTWNGTGKTWNLASLFLNPSASVWTVGGNLSSTGTVGVDLDRTFAATLADGDYKVATITGTWDPAQFNLQDLSDISDIYKYTLERSDSGTDLVLRVRVDTGKALVWNAANGATWSDASATEWVGQATAPAGKIVYFNTDPFGDATELTVNIAAAGVTPTQIFVETNKTYIFQGGSISDAPGVASTLTVQGAGILRLDAANAYTGGTTLKDGTVVMNNTASLGTTGSISFEGGTLEYGSMADWSGHDISDRFVVAQNADLNLSVADGRTASIGRLGDTITGAVTLVKTGLGTLQLTQSYMGDIDQKAGALTLKGSTYGGQVTVDEGSFLHMDANQVTTLNNMFGGTGTVTLDSGSFSILGAGTAEVALVYGASLAGPASMIFQSGTELAGGIDIQSASTGLVLAGNAAGSLISVSAAITGEGRYLNLQNGIFTLKGAAATDSTAGLAVSNTATLKLDGASTVLPSLHTAEGGMVEGTASQNLTLQEGVLNGILSGAFTLNVQDPDASVALGATAQSDGSTLFNVGGGILDLGQTALTNSLTITGGKLAQADNWLGNVTASLGSRDADGHVMGNTGTLDLGGLRAGSLKSVTLPGHATVTNIGTGTVALDRGDLRFTLSNITTDTHTGTAMIVFNNGGTNTLTMSAGNKLYIDMDDEVIALMRDLAPADPLDFTGKQVKFVVTDGSLGFTKANAADFVTFNPLLETWGLQVADVQGGTLIVDGNLEVWFASKLGDITRYDDLDPYRGLVVDRNMTISLASPTAPGETLVVKNLYGMNRSDLSITGAMNPDGSQGTANVTLMNSVNTTFSGNITADSNTALSKTGSGTLTVQGNLAARGTLDVQEGTLALASKGENSLNSVDISHGATLSLQGRGGNTVATTLNSSGGILLGEKAKLTINGTSTLMEGSTLNGMSGSAVEIVSGGSLMIAAGAGVEGIGFDLKSGSLLDVASDIRAASLNGSGSLSGAGSIALSGGNGTFAGAMNAYSGTLKLEGGSQTLAGAGSTAASLIAVNGSNLVLDYSGSNARYASVAISGGSTLTLLAHNGSGTNNQLTLSGNSTVAHGTLALTLNTDPVQNLSAGYINMAGGATLGFGEGSVMRFSASSNSKLIQGTSPVEIVIVNGATTGSDNITVAYDQLFGKYFDAAGSRLEQRGNQLILVTAASQSPYYETIGLSHNAQAGGALLDRALRTVNPQAENPGSELAQAMNAIDSRISAGNRAGASQLMAAISGATVTTLNAAQLGTQERNMRAIRNRTVTMGIDPSVVQQDLPYWNAWASFNGANSDISQNGDQPGYKLSSWGGTIGADSDISRHITLGVAFTANYGKLTATGADTASGHVDSYLASLYLRGQNGKWSHVGILTGGTAKADLDRTVSYGAGQYKTSGTTDGSSFGAMYELAYDIALDTDYKSLVQPLFNASLNSARMKGYTETGAGNANLSVENMDTTYGTIGVGGRYIASIGQNLFNRTATLEARAMLLQDIGDRQVEADVAFADAKGYKRTVEGIKPGSTGVEVGLGLTIPVELQSSIFMEINLDARSRSTEVSGGIGYRYNF